MLAVTFVGAVQAVRGVIWFALACAAILPVALDGLLTRADPSSRRVNLAISVASLVGLTVALVVALTRPAGWFEQEWPDEQLAAVRTATADPGVRLFATDGTADWLLWRLPDLRGRIAYDVRFKLYDAETIERISRYGNREGANWKSLADGYPVVIVDDRGHLRAFRAEPRREGDVSRPRDRHRDPGVVTDRDEGAGARHVLATNALTTASRETRERAVLLVVALVATVSVIFQLVDEGAALTPDSASFMRAASGILDGNPFDVKRTPGYPVLLAVAGKDTTAAIILQGFLFVFCAVGVGFLTQRATGRWWAGATGALFGLMELPLDYTRTITWSSSR